MTAVTTTTLTRRETRAFRAMLPQLAPFAGIQVFYTHAPPAIVFLFQAAHFLPEMHVYPAGIRQKSVFSCDLGT